MPFRTFAIGEELETWRYRNGLVEIKFNELSPAHFTQVVLERLKRVIIQDITFDTKKKHARSTISKSQIEKLGQSVTIQDLTALFQFKDKNRPTGRMTIRFLDTKEDHPFELNINLALYQKRNEKGGTSSYTCRVTEIRCERTCLVYCYSEVTKKVKRTYKRTYKKYQDEDVGDESSDDEEQDDHSNYSTCSLDAESYEVPQKKRKMSASPIHQISNVGERSSPESENTFMSAQLEETSIENCEYLFEWPEIANLTNFPPRISVNDCKILAQMLAILGHNQFQPNTYEKQLETVMSENSFDSNDCFLSENEIFEKQLETLMGENRFDSNDCFLSENDIQPWFDQVGDEFELENLITQI